VPLLRTCPTPAEAAAAAAERLALVVEDAVAKRGRALVALAGGKTPEALYAALVEGARGAGPGDGPARRAPWERVEWFFSDERAVPASDSRSNLGLARRALFGPLGIPAERIRAFRGDAQDLFAEAARAEAEVRARAPDGALDVVLLGMGPDGHVASLFPGAPATSERSRWIVPAAPGMDPLVPRLTFTFPLINAAREVHVLAMGAAKSKALRRVLVEKDGSLPAARIVPRSRRVAWFVDEAAASGMRL
jgi:6-phosphogluconolactonase